MNLLRCYAKSKQIVQATHASNRVHVDKAMLQTASLQPRTMSSNLRIVSAQANTTDWFTAGFGTTLSIASAQRFLVSAWGADQCTVLRLCLLVLQCALWLSCYACWDVFWAEDAKIAFWRAESTCNTSYSYIDFTSFAWTV